MHPRMQASGVYATHAIENIRTVLAMVHILGLDLGFTHPSLRLYTLTAALVSVARVRGDQTSRALLVSFFPSFFLFFFLSFS